MKIEYYFQDVQWDENLKRIEGGCVTLIVEGYVIYHKYATVSAEESIEAYIEYVFCDGVDVKWLVPDRAYEDMREALKYEWMRKNEIEFE